MVELRGGESRIDDGFDDASLAFLDTLREHDLSFTGKEETCAILRKYMSTASSASAGGVMVVRGALERLWGSDFFKAFRLLVALGLALVHDHARGTDLRLL